MECPTNRRWHWVGLCLGRFLSSKHCNGACVVQRIDKAAAEEDATTPSGCHGNSQAWTRCHKTSQTVWWVCVCVGKESVSCCRSWHKDHEDEKHQVPSHPTLLDVIAAKATYGNVDLSYASGLERADSTKIQGRADHDPARCCFMLVYILHSHVCLRKG